MKLSEHQIQCSFIEELHWLERRHPVLKLGFAVPNGGKRSKATAGKLKAEGVRSGVPDWMLPVPADIYLGLSIEFKSGSGRVSDEQREFMRMLIAAGWECHVCYSSEHGIRALKQYLAKLTPELAARIVRP